MTMARSAISANQAIDAWPKLSTIAAAISGPSACPKLPPTWNSDCANPCRPPDAIRATRADSGWKMAEPKPTIAAAELEAGFTDSALDFDVGRTHARPIRILFSGKAPAGQAADEANRTVNCPRSPLDEDLGCAISCAAELRARD